MSRLRVSTLILVVLVVSLLLASGTNARDNNSPIDPPRQVVEKKIVTSDELYRYEITGSILSDTVVRRTIERWERNYGINWPESGLVVYNVGTVDKPDILIVPNALQIEEIVTEIFSDGTAEVDASVTLRALKDNTLDITEGDTQTAVLATSSWQFVQQQCFAREDGAKGWIDSCYKIHQLSGDGDSNYDYYQLEHFATAKSKSPYSLLTAHVASDRDLGSPPMYWVDWSPRSDQTVGNCQTYQVSVGALGIGIASYHDLCEKWDITKYADPGKFRNEWKNYFGFTISSEREVAYMLAVKVPEGSFPIWVLNYGYYASI